MRATVLRRGQLVVDTVPEPVPGPKQVLCEIIACGICGTDLHAARFGDEFVRTAHDTGSTIFQYDPQRDLILGHELVGRVLDVGSLVDKALIGTVNALHPVIVDGGVVRSLGYANDFPGGYSERCVVEASGLVCLPVDMEPRLGALVEPIAVGLHAVDRSQAVEHGSAIVLGCGPVGLAVIAALVLRSVPLIVAADFSPYRRAVAGQMGAHVVVDPREHEPIVAWSQAGGRGPTTIVDAIGVPGIIETAMLAVPRYSEVVVAGVCMQTDTFRPAIGINKELRLTFVLGWTAREFSASLGAIADGTVDVTPLITGEVGLDGVAGAFDRLARPDADVKVLVRPNL